MELGITIQQTQQYDLSGAPIYFSGNNVNSLNPTTGTLPKSRQWRNFGSPIDATEMVSDLFKLKMTWTTEADNEGYITPGSYNTRKAFTGDLTFEAESYRLLKGWLVDDVSSQLNTVDVTITHYDNNNKACGTYTNWLIKATDLKWCEDGTCTFDVSMRQKDEQLNCIKSTLVSDDWQGWFNNNTTHKHPRFSYCNEIRPNGSLIIQWVSMTIITTQISLLAITIVPVILIVMYIIRMIIGVINGIITIVGGNKIDTKGIDDAINSLEDVKHIKENFSNFFVEGAGCGREHPAPLIRDYISNVCTKCGVKVDGSTAPIFFAQNIDIETSSRGFINVFNPHYNDCYLNTPSRKGVRRFKNLSIFGYSEPDTTTFYIYDNRPLMALDQFLDHIKQVYNAEWNIRSGTLYFQRKDFYRLPNNTPILDFSANGADRNIMLHGLCFTWNDRNIPAATKGLYTQDGIDTCGDEAMKNMNDTFSYGDATKNPVYSGLQDKAVPFGATRFRGDGVETDYIMDAFQTVVNISFVMVGITGAFSGNQLFDFVQPALEKYADYVLLMRDDKNALPKIITWDGGEYINARALKTYASIDTFGSEPAVNHNYNPKLYGSVTGWSTSHPPNTFVRGSKLTFGNHPVGIYRARDLFGTKFYEMTAYLINYPMYMGIGYEDSMWDWFHWIDDPNRRSVLNRTATAKIPLCCDYLTRLRLFGNGGNTAVGERVLLSNNDGVITSIEVSYDTEDDYGQYIQVTADS